MDSAFTKLAQKICFTPSPSFDGARVLAAKLSEQKVFKITLATQGIVPLDELIAFYDCLSHNFPHRTEIDFRVQTCQFDLLTLKQYLRWIVGDLLKQPKLAVLIYHESMKLTDEELCLNIDNEKIYQDCVLLQNKISAQLKRFGFENLTLKLNYHEPHGDLLGQEKRVHLKQVSQAWKEYQRQPSASLAPSRRSRRGYYVSQIGDLKDAPQSQVEIQGQVFELNYRHSAKTNVSVVEIGVSDYQEAIMVKKFLRTDHDRQTFQKQTWLGRWVSVQGAHQFDNYKRAMVVMAKKITVIKSPLESDLDDAPIRRVELSLRTQMSTMDGILNPKQIVQHALQNQFTALAITDLNSVQAFPDFYNESKDTPLKAIYGVTFQVIDHDPGTVRNGGSNQKLSDLEYVVFDLETTGLSPIVDDIIEFGGVKIVGGKIVDRRQFFIKPDRPINAQITRLTGITKEHVHGAVSQVEGVKQILEYLGSAVLVAHNASFDGAFLEEKIARFKLPPLTNPVVDTLIVARIVDPKSKKYRLENFVKRLGVNYQRSSAHRADYDARVLAEAWLQAVPVLANQKIITLQDLADYRNQSLWEKAFAYEVTLLVKNQRGLRDLFQLVSLSHTKQYWKTPKLFWSDLAHLPNLLIGSGGLSSHLVNKMLRGTTEQVRHEISRYDYIECQPPENFAHLIGPDLSKEQLEEILKMVVDQARQQNKLVVASGDVRYLRPQDQVFYQVYVYSKGLGGERHPLHRFLKNQAPMPELHFRTTRQMKKAFAFLEDARLIEEVVVLNTQKIADQIDKIVVIKDRLYPPTLDQAHEKLVGLVYQNARQTYGSELPQIVADRLKKEFEPIQKYGYSVIYWISHLLVNQSLKDGYLVGSRGSVGSSLVATLAKITEVNPLIPHYLCRKCQTSQFVHDPSLNSGYDLPSQNCPNCAQPMAREGQNIPFETFLGFGGDKVPDIDLNFSGEYQGAVHDQVRQLFGVKHCFRAGTISTVAERTAFGFVKNWEEETDREISEMYRRFLVQHVTGTKRTTGQHPGGIIVVPQDQVVEDFTPVNYPANDTQANWLTTHFDFHAIHDNVVKLDLLGHDDPTAIRNLEKLTGVLASSIPMSEPRVLSLFSSPQELGVKPEEINGETTGALGIPEFGTKFVRLMLKSVQVKSFGDLISVSGLSHGTDVWTNNAEQLIKNRGLKLHDLVSCRDDIMNYLIAQRIDESTAFTIMEQVRKGNSISEHQEKLLTEHKVPAWYIDSLKKIKYIFPKAHATAYVIMAWRIAWFKLYHPLAYYATYFSTRADVSELTTLIGGKQLVEERLQDLIKGRNKRGSTELSNKEQALIPILEIANEAYARKIKFLNVDLKRSQATTWVIDQSSRALIAPFVAIDGLGINAANSIVAERQKEWFTSREDLYERTLINRTILAKLAELGVLNQLHETNQIAFNFFK